MLRSSEVAHMKPSSFWSMSWILGIGKGCLLILLFSSLRSAKERRDPSGLLIVNIGQAHSEWLIFLKIPCLHNLSTSSLSFCSWEYGTGYGFAWYGAAVESLRTRSTGSVFQVPTVPSYRCSYF